MHFLTKKIGVNFFLCNTFRVVKITLMTVKGMIMLMMIVKKLIFLMLMVKGLIMLMMMVKALIILKMIVKNLIMLMMIKILDCHSSHRPTQSGQAKSCHKSDCLMITW